MFSAGALGKCLWGIASFEAKQVAHTIKQEIVNGMMTIYIPRGMQKEVKLPDGTRVILNAESQLTYNTNQFGQKKTDCYA